MTGSNTAARRDPTRIFAKNRRFSVHIACMVVDGVLDGCNFALIYLVIRGVFEGSFTMSSALAMTAAVGLMASERGGNIDKPECCAISFPGFFELLKQ